MGDSATSTNTKQIETLARLQDYERAAIVLKSEGQKYSYICKLLEHKFNHPVAEYTVRSWFMAGGRLEQAYFEYNEHLANSQLREAKQMVKGLTKTAGEVMRELMGDRNDPMVRFHAAKTVMGKYLPDRQVVLDGKTAEDDLPAELSEEGDDILNGNDSQPGQIPDDAPEGESPDQEVGGSSGKNLSP